jgi:hypothetical protein
MIVVVAHCDISSFEKSALILIFSPVTKYNSDRLILYDFFAQCVIPLILWMAGKGYGIKRRKTNVY